MEVSSFEILGGYRLPKAAENPSLTSEQLPHPKKLQRHSDAWYAAQREKVKHLIYYIRQ